MKGLKIHDLKIEPLRQIIDQRGAVYHYLKSGDDSFKGFGEAYYSKINAGVIKGWKYHKDIFQNFCVPLGAVEIVIYDGRENSESYGCIEKILLDDNLNYARLSMPPKLWYSFKSVSEQFSLLANIIDQPHRPDEAETLPLDTKEIPYEWR